VTATSPAADAIFPTLDLAPVERARPGGALADLFPEARDGPARSDASAPHVTLLVVPAIISVPSREGPAGGNEASEPSLKPGDESGLVAHAAQPQSAAPARQPEPRDQPAPPGPGVLAHFVSTTAAIVVALGLFCACLVVLRRLGVSLPIDLRTGPAVGSGFDAPVPMPHAEPVRDIVAEDVAAMPLDLGPTYAEEVAQREEAARENEKAMLRHIFDQNVRLREQIEGLSEPAPSASEG
jgi:hypothetical protein